MTRFISLILVLCLLIANSVILASCSNGGDPDKDGIQNPSVDSGDSGTENGKNSIVVPLYKDYKRETINYDDITYKRPDVVETSEQFLRIADIISENRISFDSQLSLIEDIEDDYYNIFTMAAISNIQTSKDASDGYWAEEYEYITTLFPSFSQSVEKMFVAAANSENAEKFEDEYFGEGLIKKYKDGGIYTDALVEILEEEAKLEAEYSALSSATVKITYEGRTDTVDAILETYKETYGINSKEYLAAKSFCDILYQDELEKISEDILISLIKVRRRIGEEYEGGYLEFAYQGIYHDYSPEDTLDFIKDVAEYVLPVYVNLSSKNVFYEYKKTEKPTKVDRVNLINSAYLALEKTDKDLFEIYSYMLQHKLYDIDTSEDNRFEGAFTTYLDDYNAPYMFISTSGNTLDYTTLFHEFGHFSDFYINYNSESSLDLSEVSSQALELLMLTKLGDTLSASGLDYLVRYELENALTTLIFQSFYALFEHYAYELPEEKINKETLNATVVRAAKELGLNTEAVNSISYVMIPHIFLYPTYVQSYCTSLVASLEIYFLEVESEGAGFDAYKALIDREDDTLTFEEQLKSAGISSPFEDDALKKVADKIHFSMYGKHFFQGKDGDIAA